MADADEVSDAIVVHYGKKHAQELLPQATRLAAAFYASAAYATDADLTAVGDRAAAQFRAAHSEVSDQAVKALAWCHTWDWK